MLFEGQGREAKRGVKLIREGDSMVSCSAVNYRYIDMVFRREVKL